jgi:hypothetical protein
LICHSKSFDLKPISSAFLNQEFLSKFIILYSVATSFHSNLILIFLFISSQNNHTAVISQSKTFFAQISIIQGSKASLSTSIIFDSTSKFIFFWVKK